MKKFLKMALMLPVIASISLFGCKKDTEDTTPVTKSPVDGKTLIFESTATAAEVDVKVYADQPIFNGYNRLYVMLYKEGTKTVLKDAHVELMPEMNMMSGMMHSAPVEDPETTQPADGVYQGAVVFVMPSAGNGTWTLGVHVHNHANNVEDEVMGEVTVAASDDIKLYSFVSPIDSSSIFVSLVEPVKAAVGNNNFEIAVHKRLSMMEWPIVSDLNVEIEPIMPSMGHGSPGNINPIYLSKGHYGSGLVNFTMNGLWNINITLKDQNSTLVDDSHFFEVTL